MENTYSDVLKTLRILERPVVLYPGWYEIPEPIKKEIYLQRAEQALLQKEGEATDAEALAYLYSASLAVPLRSEYVRIYLYLFCRTMRRQGIEPPPDLCEVESLSEDEERLLRKLKQWLWERSMKGAKRHKK